MHRKDKFPSDPKFLCQVMLTFKFQFNIKIICLIYVTQNSVLFLSEKQLCIIDMSRCSNFIRFV